MVSFGHLEEGKRVFTVKTFPPEKEFKDGTVPDVDAVWPHPEMEASSEGGKGDGSAGCMMMVVAAAVVVMAFVSPVSVVVSVAVSMAFEVVTRRWHCVDTKVAVGSVAGDRGSWQCGFRR